MNIYKVFTFIMTMLITFVILAFIYIQVGKIFPNTEYPSHVQKTLYVDRDFSDDEFVYIMEAAVEWHESTNGIITFDVEKMPQHYPKDTRNSITIIRVNPYYPQVIMLDTSNKYSTLGVYNQDYAIPCISLVSERITDNVYKAVVMHELGHALGLEHIQGFEGIGTLMYPYIDVGSDRLTLTDLEKFCEKYHCDAKNLQH